MLGTQRDDKPEVGQSAAGQTGWLEDRGQVARAPAQALHPDGPERRRREPGQHRRAAPGRLVRRRLPFLARPRQRKNQPAG